MRSRCLLAVSVSVLYLVGTLSTVWHVAGQNLKLVHPRFQVQLHSDHWGSHRSKEEDRSRAQNSGSWSVTESRSRKLENYKRCPYLKVLTVCLLNSPQPPNWPEFQRWRYLFHTGRLQLEYTIFFLQRHIRSQFELSLSIILKVWLHEMMSCVTNAYIYGWMTSLWKKNWLVASPFWSAVIGGSSSSSGRWLTASKKDSCAAHIAIFLLSQWPHPNFVLIVRSFVRWFILQGGLPVLFWYPFYPQYFSSDSVLYLFYSFCFIGQFFNSQLGVFLFVIWPWSTLKPHLVCNRLPLY